MKRRRARPWDACAQPHRSNLKPVTYVYAVQSSTWLCLPQVTASSQALKRLSEMFTKIEPNPRPVRPLLSKTLYTVQLGITVRNIKNNVPLFGAFSMELLELFIIRI